GEPLGSRGLPGADHALDQDESSPGPWIRACDGTSSAKMRERDTQPFDGRAVDDSAYESAAGLVGSPRCRTRAAICRPYVGLAIHLTTARFPSDARGRLGRSPPTARTARGCRLWFPPACGHVSSNSTASPAFHTYVCPPTRNGGASSSGMTSPRW